MRAMIVLGHRMACLVAIAASAVSGANADAASFDCAKASSVMERLVCGDAALDARDEIMAKLYASASKVGKRETAAAKQRAWLGKAQACKAFACLADAYDRRNADLKRSEGGNAAGVDFFTDERDGASSTLNVVRPLHGFASASLTSTYVGAGGAKAGDVYAAATDAFLDLRKGPAAFADGPCKLTFERLDADRWKVSQTGKCELLGGTEFAGIFHRLP